MRDDLRILSEKYDVLRENAVRHEAIPLQDFWAKVQKWILTQAPEIQNSFNQAVNGSIAPQTNSPAPAPTATA